MKLKGTAYAYSGALIAGGIILGSLAAADVIRAQGEVVKIKKLTEAGDALSKGACSGIPASGVEVRIAPTGNQGVESFVVGETDPFGRRQIDLNNVVPSTYAWSKKRFDVWVGGEVIASLNGQAVFEEREQAMWSTLDTERCKAPKKSTDCAHIEDFLRMYPGGVHMREAKRLLGTTKDRRDRLADEETWTAITAEHKKRCLNEGDDQEFDFRTDCARYENYLGEFENGKYRKQAESILASSRALVRKREQEAVARAETQRKQEEAALLAAQKKEQRAEKKQCVARCNVGCSGFRIEDKGMCRSGCAMMCSGNECQGRCAMGCSSFTIDQHQSCFANCRVSNSCEGGS